MTKCKQQTRNDNSSLNVQFLDFSSILSQPLVISSESRLTARKIITRLICICVFNIPVITPCEQLYIVAYLFGGLLFKADYSKRKTAMSVLKSFQKFIHHLESDIKLFSGVFCVSSVASLKHYPHSLFFSCFPSCNYSV